MGAPIDSPEGYPVPRSAVAKLKLIRLVQSVISCDISRSQRCPICIATGTVGPVVHCFIG